MPVFAADTDGDGIPDDVEVLESRNPNVKDNDVFTSNRLFPMQQYRDFLGREGDAGGITFYSTLLTNGPAVRANVIESFFNSPEFSGTVSPIARLYFATFLRIPDYAGLQFQVNAYRSGTPLTVIANNFSASPEFQTRYGALTNAQYVTLLYQNVLNRTPVQAEVDFHVARLASGVTRGEVMVGFSESPEYQASSAHRVYVTMMYIGMLRRAPEQAGFDFWVAYMDAGNPGLALILGFLNAPEYHDRFLPPVLTCANVVPGNVGCEFYAVPLSNTFLDRANFGFGVTVVNLGAGPATVTISGGVMGGPVPYVVDPGDPLTVTLPWVVPLQDTGATVRQNGGAYRIVSDMPLAAYQFNALQYKVGDVFSSLNDASLLLPVAALTGNYRVMSWPSWLGQAGMFAIVATQDATSVTVAPTTTIVAGGGLTDSGGTVTLDRGDVLQVVVPTPGTLTYGSDPSGSLVTANHPVSVFGSHDAANIPADAGYADHLEGQLPPLETLGADLVIPLLRTQSGDARKHFVKLVGTQDGTAITYAPSVPPGAPAALNAGQAATFEATGHFRLTATQPVLAATFMEGGTQFPDLSGDPSMAPAVPFAQFRTAYGFFAPPDYVANRLAVVAPTGATVVLDGAPIAPASFIAVGTTGYGVADIVLSSGNLGAHRITGSAPIGITVYGYGDFTSYTYPGGTNLAR